MARRRPGLRKRLALNIFSDLYASTVAEHRLTTLFWECTLRCNLSCRHCGSDCRVDPGVPDMPLEDFLKVLDEEITPHVDPSEVLIIFSGGEVLVRDDLERAGAEVTRRGYAWGMVTTGMALTEARLRSLLAAGLRSVSVSLDGFEREHNHIRGNSRSYDRALAALRMIVREPSLTYDVVTCVTGAMVPQLEAFRDLLLAAGVALGRPGPAAGAGQRPHGRNAVHRRDAVRFVLLSLRESLRATCEERYAARAGRHSEPL